MTDRPMPHVRRKPRPDKPPKPDKPTGPSGPTGPTTPTVATGPTGPTPKPRLGSYGNASIDQWDGAFIAASEAVFRLRGVRVNPRFIKSLMEVESGGNGNYPPSRCRPSDGTDTVPACGPMQIKQAYHQHRCPDCNFKTVRGQIELATHIIGMTMKERATDEYGALTAVYFPTDDVNGTTQQAYVNRVRSLVRTMEKDAGDDEPEPEPEPKPPIKPLDPIRVIVGGRDYTAEYGFKSPAAGPYYDYFRDHGGSPNLHTGVDVPGTRGERLYTPAAGVVTCAGTGVGAGSWNTSCAAFADQDGGGAGRVEIMFDSGISMILGHCAKALVKVGQRVKAGDPVATMGGMLGTHIHLECRVWREDGRCP